LAGNRPASRGIVAIIYLLARHRPELHELGSIGELRRVLTDKYDNTHPPVPYAFRLPLHPERQLGVHALDEERYYTRGASSQICGNAGGSAVELFPGAPQAGYARERNEEFPSMRLLQIRAVEKEVRSGVEEM